MLHRLVPLLALAGCVTSELDESEPEPGDEVDASELTFLPQTGGYVGPARQCLTVQAAQTNDGTAIVSSGCMNATNAKWSPEIDTSYIRGWGGKCLTARSGKLVLWTCSNLSSQKWRNNAGRLQNNEGTCVSMSSTPGVQASVLSCGTSPAQLVSFEVERKLRVQLVFVRDAAGGGAGTLDAQAFRGNINRANLVYATAHVQFLFDPATDWTTMRDTGINRLACLPTDDPEAIARTQQIGARYEGRVVVIIKQGDGSGRSCSSGPQGGGGNTVLFRNTYIDDYVLAHELGHYLGLDHTMVRDPNNNPYDTPGKLRTLLAQNGNDASVFDPDRFNVTDTPADPGPELWTYLGWNKCDPSRPTYWLTDTIAFTPDRLNVMGYWDCPNQRFSPQQIARLRAQIELPMRRGLIETIPSPSAPRMIFGFAGHCLTDTRTTPAVGDALVMTPCVDPGSKLWTFGSNGEIKTANGLCLKEGPAFALRRPTLATCTGAWDQKFVRAANGDLKTPSGLCLANDNDNRFAPGNLVLFACTANELNKFWSYLPRPTSSPN